MGNKKTEKRKAERVRKAEREGTPLRESKSKRRRHTPQSNEGLTIKWPILGSKKKQQ